MSNLFPIQIFSVSFRTLNYTYIYIMNRICHLFGIRYPIIQGGMVWCSGWRLASAVSNAGGLGLLGAGSMHPETLREHIRKCRQATDKPFGVNVPLMYPEIETIMQIIVDEGVKIVFTSAGSPKKWTEYLHNAGIKVAHVIASTRFALKCEEAGVDAIVAEGFEAGGHNGREETTTFCLIPAVKRMCALPLIAAGGIMTGEGILAAQALGADGVLIGRPLLPMIYAAGEEGFKVYMDKHTQAVCGGDGGRPAGDGAEDRLHHRLYRFHDAHCCPQGRPAGLRPRLLDQPRRGGRQGPPLSLHDFCQHAGIGNVFCPECGKGWGYYFRHQRGCQRRSLDSWRYRGKL